MTGGPFEATVTVTPVRPTWADDPALTDVTANPASIELGDSSALQWTPREDVANVVVTLPDGTTADVEPLEGRYEVTPDAVGKFTYTLEAYDEEGALLVTGGPFEATVTVTPVRPTPPPPPVNRAPVAQDDEGPEVKFGGSVEIGTATLTANDADADGDTLTVTAVSNPRHGTASLSGGTITFEHDGESDAAEGYAFTYTVSDGNGGTDTATVSGTVVPVNRAPVAQDDEGPEVKFGGSVEIDAATLTANDADADGDTLTVTAVSNPRHGTASLSGGTITFEHDGESDAAEGYAFTYTVSDGNGGTDTATVSGTVVPVNRAPVAQDDEGPEVKFGGSVEIDAATLTANDADADGDTLTVTAVSNPQHGTASLSGGTVTFEHDGESDAAEGYAFTYTVSDGNGGTDTATVSGTVEPPNRAPTAVTVTWVAPAANGEIAENVDTGAGRIRIAELFATDPDADDTHTFAVSDTAAFEVDGFVLYLRQGVALDHETTPSLTFTVTATDKGGLSVTSAEQTLTVADANEGPTSVTVTWVAPAVDGTIAENLDTGGGRIRVAVLSATDPDAGDEPAFSLEGADAGSFEVDGANLYLRRGVALDHDVKPVYVAVVVATDGAGLTARADALLRVTSETDAVARSRLGRVNEAILPELSRALVSGALEAVERRIGASRGPSGNAAGGGGSAETAQRLLWMHGTALEEGRWKQALGTSSFTLNLGGGSAAAASGSGGSAGGGSGLTLWAGGDYRSLSGGDDADAVKWDGDVVSARVGLDKRLREDLLAGLALSWSRGEIDYADRGRSGYLPIEGVHESEMLSVYPYVGWQPRENLSLWGALGYGTGDVTLKDDEAGSRSSDSEQTTAALGARTGLFSSSGLIEGGTTRLDLKGELWTSRFELDDGDLIDGLDADTSRVRLGLEGSHAHRLSGGGTLTPSAELGLRHDGGDGETGGGVEFGGALAWTNPSRGLRVEGFARTLLAHEGEVDEWGAGGLIMYMPDPGGHGLRFSLRPSWGVTGGGMERLWESDSVSRMRGYRRPDGSGRLDAEFGYGLGTAGGLLTPFGGLTLDDAARRYRFGALFELGRSLTLSFEAERRESVFDGVNHGVLLRFRYWPGGAADGSAGQRP